MIYGIIYKYTNPLNNKSYIGQTINENRRKYEHAHITPNRKGKFSSAMGHTLSEVTKFKISEAHKGKVISEYTRQLLSDKLKGREHSEEHNRKVSESNLNNPKKCKPIYKCDKKGNIICSYNSLKEASADTGILLGGISKVLIGNRPTAGGYI